MDYSIVYPVIIECMTFNQSSYIVDAMNGFTMQETSFPYICIIMDDNSTDGEQTVIMNYLRDNFVISNPGYTEETDDYVMTYAQHKTNANCYFAVYLLKYNHYSINKNKDDYYTRWKCKAKYLALCEGDDYWTLPYKLQVQYDYMETYPEVVLSCHRYNVLDVLSKHEYLSENTYFDNYKHSLESEFVFDSHYFANRWITRTLTTMVRLSAVTPNWHKGFKYARDVHFYYFVMQHGYGVCHNMNAGTYRENVSTSIYGNMRQESKDHINGEVYAELADATGDPEIIKIANNLKVINSLHKLEHVKGQYYNCLKLLYIYYRIVDKCTRFVKQGFKKEMPTISS